MDVCSWEFESPLRHHLKNTVVNINLILATFVCFFAEVVELVDTLDLGSSAARRRSSSLLFGTISNFKGLK